MTERFRFSILRAIVCLLIVLTGMTRLPAEDATKPTTSPQAATTSQPLTRVAIYDHSDGTANGPKNLMSFHLG